MVASVIDKNKRDLVRRLIREHAKNVRFRNGIISFDFDGCRIRNRVEIKPSVKWVGTWSRKTNKVLLDDDMYNDIREVISLALHESVEKYLHQKYGLSTDAEGHYVAEHVEKDFAKRAGINWNDYMWKAEFVHRKEMNEHEKKLKKQIKELKKKLSLYKRF